LCAHECLLVWLELCEAGNVRQNRHNPIHNRDISAKS
jgi:hypothetical protein